MAAMMPNYLAFGIVLFVIGLAAQTFTTSTNSIVQTSTEPGMRGRVIAILFAVALGGTPVDTDISTKCNRSIQSCRRTSALVRIPGRVGHCRTSEKCYS